MKQTDPSADLITRIKLAGVTPFDLRSSTRLSLSPLRPAGSLIFTVPSPTVVELSVRCGDPKSCIGPDLAWSLEFTADGLPDDASDDFFSTSIITGAINGHGTYLDTDWYRVAPQEEGHLVQLVGSGNVWLELSELDGTVVARHDEAFSGAPRERRLKVSFLGSLRFPREPVWWVRLNDLGVDEVSDSVSAASPLTIGQTYDGRFERFDDIDAFVFESTSGHFYSISTGNPKASVTYVDESGQSVTAHSPVYVRAAESSAFPLRIGLDDGGFARNALYHLLVRDLGFDESEGNVSVAVPLDGGVARAAFQAPIDVDTLSVQSTASVVQVVVDTTSLLTARVVQLDGTVTTHLPRPRLAFAVRPDRVRRIELQPFVDSLRPLSGVPVGLAYEVSASEVSDDFDDDVATPIMIGTPVNGRIDFEGDMDFFTFNLSSASKFRIHGAGGCVFFTLVGLREPQRSLYETENLFGFGRYELRVAGDHCATTTYWIEVTTP
jgi:hypothetical protein